MTIVVSRYSINELSKSFVLRWYVLSDVVAGCRCRCWGTANYFSILMRGRKIGKRVPESNPGPERSKPKTLTTAFFFVYYYQILCITCLYFPL